MAPLAASSGAAADELQELLGEASRVFADYVRQGQQPHAAVVSGRAVDALQRDLDLFPEQGLGARGIWGDVGVVCDAATNTWSSKFLFKLYAAPTPIGVVGEALTALLNNNSHVFRASPAGSLIEARVAAKLAALAGFPEQAEGLTFPGGSYSNMHALMTARNRRFPAVKQQGLCALAGVRPAVFTSRHAHYSIDKAAMAAGIGLDGVHHVPTDSDGRMDVAELRRMVQQAAADGQTPFFVNATMGTTVLGACDPLADIAAVCEELDVWLHVDGSWGGPLGLFAETPATAPTFAMPRGRIDSMSVNPHKLLGVPLQCSFLLVRDGLDIMRQALGLGASYLFHAEDADGADGCVDIGDATLGCGRRPDALKFWLMWRYYGTQYFVRRVAHARRMALRLAALVQTRSTTIGRWALVADPPGTCVCFWFVPRQLAAARDRDESWGLATRRICTRINAAGSMLIDYATVDHFQDGKCCPLPMFFRVPLNSPDVSDDTLAAILDTIEHAAAELYGK
ncbi:Glutamate decarboxylase 2 [Coemansia spiralis]|nr:Glutamate decarboxylase 2 [Coemansia spiralis]